MEIESITIGSGKDRIHYTTNRRYQKSPCYVDEIHVDGLVYTGHKNGKIRFEITRGPGVLISYKDDSDG